MSTLTPETETLLAPGADTPVPSTEGISNVSVSGSSCESRMADLLARLADADAIGASRIRAWDRLQERRSA